MRSWSDRLAVADLETTGVDPASSRIVSAFVGVLDTRGRVVAERSWLADPGVEIPDDAVAVHGIDTRRVRADGRPAAEVVAEIVATVRAHLGRGIPLVVYNAPFDLTVLHVEALRHGIEPLGDVRPVVDPLVVDRAVDPDRRGKRTLAATAELYGVEILSPHEARADAVAAGLVAQALARHHQDALDLSADALHDRQRVWAAEQAAGFAAYLLRAHGRSVDEPDDWPLVVRGSGRHRADPLRIAAAVIERADGALLFVRKRGTRVLMQPGGKLEPGEGASAALVRELREELGLRIRTDELIPVGRFSAPAANEHGLVVDAQVFDAPLTGDPVAAAEIEELAWIHPDDPATYAGRDIAPLSRDLLIPLVRARREG